MTTCPEEREGRVAPATAFYSILGFWVFYAVLVSLRALVMGFGSPGEMAVRRMVVTLVGVAVTWVLYLVLRQFDRRRLALRVVMAFSLAAPFALAMAAANYYAFNIYDPASLLVGNEHMNSAGEEGYALKQIVEDAISRYFFLSAWAGLYLALSYAREARHIERRAARLEQAAQQAELRSLRYQVNPHFLFNTLNSLSSLVMTGRREEAEHMIMSLSNFYRSSLKGDPLEDVPLREEAHLQQLYLDIEAVRFPDRLTTHVDIPDTLLDACVPGLILQPLVENAVRYGVSRTSSPVDIQISAREEDGRLRIRIIDSGDKSPRAEDGGSGIGLANVRDRLLARYGGEAHLACGPRSQGGFEVTLTLPIIRKGC
ncbi:MAG: histidine kinase [Sphingobium sp.]